MLSRAIEQRLFCRAEYFSWDSIYLANEVHVHQVLVYFPKVTSLQSILILSLFTSAYCQFWRCRGLSHRDPKFTTGIYIPLPAPTSRRKFVKDWNRWDSKANTADNEPYLWISFTILLYPPIKRRVLEFSFILQYPRPLVGTGKKLYTVKGDPREKLPSRYQFSFGSLDKIFPIFIGILKIFTSLSWHEVCKCRRCMWDCCGCFCKLQKHRPQQGIRSIFAPQTSDPGEIRSSLQLP